MDKDNRADNNYISYFQSVMTVGIVSSGKTAKEAEEKSRRKFKKSELTCGVLAQTPYSIAATEQWHPDLSKVKE